MKVIQFVRIAESFEYNSMTLFTGQDYNGSPNDQPFTWFETPAQTYWRQLLAADVKISMRFLRDTNINCMQSIGDTDASNGFTWLFQIMH